MSARHRATLAELDALVLEHVIRYPGLSSYEIARAKRLITDGGNVSRDRVLSALLRLLFTGAVAFNRVPWPAPGGHKITWHATRSDKMAKIPDRERAIQLLELARSAAIDQREIADPVVMAMIGMGYATLEVADAIRDRTWEITRSLKP